MTAPQAGRLQALRDALAGAGVDGFILQRTDQHGSEYLPAAEQRLAWLTGFTGSAGQAVVLPDAAAVFTDGRYTVQIGIEVDASLFERCNSGDMPPPRWLEERLQPGMRLGYDAKLIRKAEREKLARLCQGRGAELVALTPNPIDRIWTDRPPPPLAPVTAHDESRAGESSAATRQRMGEAVARRGADWLLVTAAAACLALERPRGDVPYNRSASATHGSGADGTARWFVDPAKLEGGPRLDNAVATEAYEALDGALADLGRSGARVLVDPAMNAAGFADILTKAGGRVVEGQDPIPLAKARKNPVEIEGALEAQRRDGAAVVRFLAWLDGLDRDHAIDEMAAAQRLEAERARDPLYRGPSFETISAHGPNAALPHYRVTSGTNRRLTAGTVYLVDSGGQYLDGTTDITRTVALGQPTAEVQERFTLVLKGHIALAEAVFPAGTSGGQLDTLARLALWRRGLDFDHGTGHGIGSYLCVHEGPQRIAKRGGDVPLEPA